MDTEDENVEVLSNRAPPNIDLSSPDLPGTKRVILLSMLFVIFLCLSCFFLMKTLQIQFFDWYTINFSFSLFFYPLTYGISALLTEVYGFKIGRLTIWVGALCMLIICFATKLSFVLQDLSIGNFKLSLGNQENDLLLQAVPIRVLLVFILAYLIGQFSNSMMLSRLKIFLLGEYLAIRLFISFALAIGLESVIFLCFSLWQLAPTHIIWIAIIMQYSIIFIAEIVMIPLLILSAQYCKRVDQVDYFDYLTKLTPFSFRLSD
jgi:uncharacterized PurR-regulated membrane protein YhhQ (DUF165 family)